MIRPPTVRHAVFLALLVATPAGAQTTLIRGARVIDGTGAPARSEGVRIDEGRIAAVGVLTARPGERVVDATGLVLAPGFIDSHSHHDRGLLETPDALGAVSQGITTIVVGQDGGSRLPLRDFFAELESTGNAVNVASYVGHGTLRRAVLGDDYRREATPAEIERMCALLREELAAGGLGLSTGLEYDPGIYASSDEVVALAKEAARVGGRYISHMRSEDRALWDAVDETLEIGRRAGIPVQISHLKLAMRSLWGESGRLLERLEEARRAGVDVTADVYPYTYWQSTMTVLFPDRDFDDRAAFAFALEELVAPEGMLIGTYEPRPEYEGRTLAAVAELRGEDPVDTYMALVHEAVRTDADESIVATSMAESDVVRLLQWPHANVGTDGALRGAHPRGFGAFTRVVGPWVRDGRLSLEAAVHKSTALSAEHVGLADRGVIRVGAPADLVLFDPATVGDRATREEPHRVSAGVERVWVNGVTVYEGRGGSTGARPGRVVPRPGAVPAAGVGRAGGLASGTVADSVARTVDRVFAAYDEARSPGCAVGDFDPLGMEATHFQDDPTVLVPHRAVGYAPSGDGYRISTTTLPMIGDGGVYTSVYELALWARNLADPRLGGRAWIDLMLTRGVLSGGDTLDYALGLRHGSYRGLRTVGHGGSFVGYRADLTRFPDQDLTVLTLCNRADASPSTLSLRVAEAFLGPHMEPVTTQETSSDERTGAPQADDVERSRSEQASWTGAFRSDELDVVYRVELDDGALFLRVGNDLDGTLVPAARDELVRGGLRLRAVAREEGRVRAFVVGAGRVTNLRFERVAEGGGR